MIALHSDDDTFGPGYKPELEVLSDAFGSTKTFTKEFIMNSWDLQKLKYEFLEGFSQLEQIYIANSVNVHISDLPQLVNLVYLGFFRCHGLNELTYFPKLINGLNVLYLQENDLTEKSVHKIMEWILQGPSKTTLKNVILTGNGLSHSQIGNFSQIFKVFL